MEKFILDHIPGYKGFMSQLVSEKLNEFGYVWVPKKSDTGICGKFGNSGRSTMIKVD